MYHKNDALNAFDPLPVFKPETSVRKQIERLTKAFSESKHQDEVGLFNTRDRSINKAAYSTNSSGLTKDRATGKLSFRYSLSELSDMAEKSRAASAETQTPTQTQVQVRAPLATDQDPQTEKFNSGIRSFYYTAGAGKPKSVDVVVIKGRDSVPTPEETHIGRSSLGFGSSSLLVANTMDDASATRTVYGTGSGTVCSGTVGQLIQQMQQMIASYLGVPVQKLAEHFPKAADAPSVSGISVSAAKADPA